jgi:hypothetical protein
MIASAFGGSASRRFCGCDDGRPADGGAARNTSRATSVWIAERPIARLTMAQSLLPLPAGRRNGGEAA